MRCKKSEKKIQRSVLSGRIVNGRDVILASEAKDFVKKMGYDLVCTIFDRPLSSEQLVIKLEKEVVYG